MAANSKIEWCDHTASPWHGCTKVAPGCDHCYAAQTALRNPGTLGVWGDGGTRIKSKSFVDNLRLWNRQAAKAGKVVSVFPSICDPFEDRPELVPWREEMFQVIDECPHVRLLLLTKRPENIRRLTPGNAGRTSQLRPIRRRNVWLGTSVSEQATAERNIPLLLACRGLSPVLFVSAEPLLGPVDIAGWMGDYGELQGGPYVGRKTLDWIIVGGESGPHARPMHPQWARDLRGQCVAAGVPFHFKQWGEWIPYELGGQQPFFDSQHGDMFDAHLFPETIADAKPVGGWYAPELDSTVYRRVGKKAAGRLLDGREWNEYPEGQQ